MNTFVDESVLVNEYIKHTNLPVNRKGFHIRDILREYWKPFLRDNPHLDIRPVVLKSIDNILKCRTIDNGYFFYECKECDDYFMVLHTCKDRFCNSCGVKYAKERANSVNSILIDCKHRHITFTIPDSLRHYFRRDRRRLNILFEAVNQTFKYMLKKHAKSKKYQAGFISVIHTFGRALTFNVHIHSIISEGMVDCLGNFKHLKYFNYELLRKSFMKSLLDLLHKELGNSFYKEKCQLYRDNDEGFYVHAPGTNSDFKEYSELVKYVLRYTGRPPMAESRILNVDYKNDLITYFYEPHEDDHLPENEKTGPVEVTEHIYEFIKKLIIHIPEHQFKTIRYYGLYSSKGRTLIPNYKKKLNYRKYLFNTKHRFMLLEVFKYDILKCRCGATMKLNIKSSYFP